MEKILSKAYSLFEDNPPEYIYHYTNLNGASGIIESKSLWLTKFHYLNDTSELYYGVKLFKDFVQEYSDEKITSPEEKDFLLKVSNFLSVDINNNTCVASFCENEDLLSQWRGYGNNGNGVALGFNTKLLKSYLDLNNIKIKLLKCSYKSEKQKEIFELLIEDALENFRTINPSGGLFDFSGILNSITLQVVPYFKNSAFKEEQEWRLVTENISYKNDCFHARVSNYRSFEYYKLDLSKPGDKRPDFLQKIIIGPNRNQDLVRRALFTLLQKNDYIYIDIENSKITYRT